MSANYRDLFSGQIELTIGTTMMLFAAYPASAGAFTRLRGELKAAEKRRRALADEGVEVPPLMIVSTTDACNLACAGCYACQRGGRPENALPDQRVAEILNEASELGVGIAMLAGGEPLMSHGWLDALGRHREMLGIVFTNGTLFDDERREWFSEHRHIIPAFSIEGDEAQTDARRGTGVYKTVRGAMRGLRDARIPFGVSVTVTSENIGGVLREEFVWEYIRAGCLLFVFVEYVPVEKGSEPMVLSKADKERLNAFAIACGEKCPALFVPFPGDEAQYGGCLAAGRGFVHVSAAGDVEPCPFAPFSDANLRSGSLREALSSNFLSKIRENHGMLKEGDGGCALWHNREWLKGML